MAAIYDGNCNCVGHHHQCGYVTLYTWTSGWSSSTTDGIWYNTTPTSYSSNKIVELNDPDELKKKKRIRLRAMSLAECRHRAWLHDQEELADRHMAVHRSRRPARRRTCTATRNWRKQ